MEAFPQLPSSSDEEADAGKEAAVQATFPPLPLSSPVNSNGGGGGRAAADVDSRSGSSNTTDAVSADGIGTEHKQDGEQRTLSPRADSVAAAASLALPPSGGALEDTTSTTSQRAPKTSRSSVRQNVTPVSYTHLTLPTKRIV